MRPAQDFRFCEGLSDTCRDGVAAAGSIGRCRTSLGSYAGERRSERVSFRFPQSTDTRRRLMIIHDRTAPTAAERDCPTLFVAIEPSRSSWLVAVHTPPVDKIGMHRLAAGDVEGLLALIARQRARAEKALARSAGVGQASDPMQANGDRGG